MTRRGSSKDMCRSMQGLMKERRQCRVKAAPHGSILKTSARWLVGKRRHESHKRISPSHPTLSRPWLHLLWCLKTTATLTRFFAWYAFTAKSAGSGTLAFCSASARLAWLLFQCIWMTKQLLLRFRGNKRDPTLDPAIHKPFSDVLFGHEGSQRPRKWPHQQCQSCHRRAQQPCR